MVWLWGILTSALVALTHWVSVRWPGDTTLSLSTPSFQLPRHVRPTHYELTIWSDLQRAAFQGAVHVQLDVYEPTQTIQFHAGENLDVGDVYVDTPVDAFRLTPQVDRARERVLVALPRSVAAGPASLTVGFRAPIDRTMRGYYASSWAHDGKNGTYAVTQFSPAAARRAFPGWDEPFFKATYAFRMIHRDDTMALGNMPVTDTRPLRDAHDLADLLYTERSALPAPALGQDAWRVSQFDTTPTMSTYIVGWANGQFAHRDGAYRSPLSGRTVPLRIYATPDYIETTEHGLRVMEKELPMYERLFDIPYPLPKLDGLVVADFDVNAMENWGLITSRTSVFAYHAKAALDGLKRATGTIGHELGHMWFGNMVTMVWWDNLWLKEAFATFMGEVLVMGRAFPSWDTTADFVVNHWQVALALDAKASTHPIETPLNTERVENALTQTFDAIPYSKGASVLRMLATMLGEPVFMQGVRKYLTRHLYNNTITQDLWDCLAEASGQPIAKIMAPWTLEPGFPVLSITPTPQGIRVHQERFLEWHDPSRRENKHTTLWHVPLALKTVKEGGDVSVQYDLMLNGTRSVDIALPAGTAWKLNAETMGVYRVAYDKDQLNALAAFRSVWSVADRVGLVADAFATAKAGYLATTDALEFLKVFVTDDSPVVVQAVEQCVQELTSAWWEQSADDKAMLQQWRAQLFGPVARNVCKRMHAAQDDDNIAMCATVLPAAAGAGDMWAQRALDEQFALLRAGQNMTMPADLLAAVLSHGVAQGGVDAYEFVWQIYEAPATPAHKVAAMSALGAATESALIDRTLSHALGEEIKTQDIPAFFAGLSANTASRRRLWVATATHFDRLARRFTRNFSFKNIIRASMQRFTSEEDAADIEAFFAERDTSTYDMSLAQGLETIRAQAAWLQRERLRLHAWLRAQLA